MLSADRFVDMVVRGDVAAVEDARHRVRPGLLPELVDLYWQLETWPQRSLLIRLLREQWSPVQLSPIMIDILRAPFDWPDRAVADSVQRAQAVGLAYVSESFDAYDRFCADRAALRRVLDGARRQLALALYEPEPEPEPGASEPIRTDYPPPTGSPADPPPLVCAAANNQPGVVDRLIRGGIEVDARDRDGHTALMHAARRGYPGIVERLLRAGADPATTTASGKTARDLVRLRRRAEVLALLSRPPKPGAAAARTTGYPWYWRQRELLGYAAAGGARPDPAGGWPCLAVDCAGRTRRLVSIRRDGVPHDADEHGTQYDHRFLTVCEACGAGRLESFSHDCGSTGYDPPGSEVTDLGWLWRVPAEDVAMLREAFRDCPQWRDYACRCAAHRSLAGSAHDMGERWRTLVRIALADGLPKFAPVR